MDVIRGLLGEAEVSQFDADDFGDLYAVLNDMTAWLIREYMNSEDSDPTVVEHIDKYLGDSIRSLTLARVLSENGIMELLQTLDYRTILLYYRNNTDCYDKLKFLEENYKFLKPNSSPPTARDFQNFKKMLSRVVSKMKTNGIPLTYPDIMKRVQENSFMFYSPHSQLRGTSVGLLHARRNVWHMCYRGIDYDRYCTENNITNAQRRMF